MSSIRTHDYYMKRYLEQEKSVKALKAQIDQAIESAEFSLAALRCSELQSALLSLNTTANILADMES